ncbi:MAG TPA: cupredoxin domain-containing protein [Acetobacteraceae bacterium]|nr:cupredoxin domain-containing protein [Acetobacteraceae bacterium]
MTDFICLMSKAFETDPSALHSRRGWRRPAIHELPVRITEVVDASLLRHHDEGTACESVTGSQGLLSPMDRPSRRSFAASAVRVVVLPFVVALAGCATPAAPVAQSTVPVGGAGETVTVVLADFSFSPAHITLRVGVPVRLRLVNQSTGGHDFSAPAFFAASSFLPGSASPADGKIEVSSHQTVEIALTPRVPGSYPVECTHFLHSLFGMTATIEVVA